MTKQCAICKDKNCRAYLFEPSGIFVFLCDSHASIRVYNNDIPIKEWVDNKRKEFEEEERRYNEFVKNSKESIEEDKKEKHGTMDLSKEFKQMFKDNYQLLKKLGE